MLFKNDTWVGTLVLRLVLEINLPKFLSVRFSLSWCDLINPETRQRCSVNEPQAWCFRWPQVSICRTASPCKANVKHAQNTGERPSHTVAERVRDTPKGTHLKSGRSQQGALRVRVCCLPLFTTPLSTPALVRAGQGPGR